MLPVYGSVRALGSVAGTHEEQPGKWCVGATVDGAWNWYIGEPMERFCRTAFGAT